MKYLITFAMLFSFNLFADEAEVSSDEKEVEALLVELSENEYDDKEVVKTLNQPSTRLPASVED